MRSAPFQENPTHRDGEDSSTDHVKNRQNQRSLRSTWRVHGERCFTGLKNVPYVFVRARVFLSQRHASLLYVLGNFVSYFHPDGQIVGEEGG